MFKLFDAKAPKVLSFSFDQKEKIHFVKMYILQTPTPFCGTLRVPRPSLKTPGSCINWKTQCDSV